MKIITNLAVASSLFVAGSASVAAAEVETAGSAISLCKEQAIATHSDYVSSKSKRIKQTRDGYRVNLRVVLADKSINSKCEVSRDGTVEYKA